MKNSALIVAGFLLTLVSILHMIRFALSVKIMVASFTIPMIWSLYAASITAILALWMFLAFIKK